MATFKKCVINECVLNEMAFWLTVDMKPHNTWFNQSWIPEYPIWSCEPRYKGDLRLIHTFYTPKIMDQLEVAQEIHKIKKIWSKP
jgi:hypothetical protein